MSVCEPPEDLPWGFVEDGAFVELPWVPMVLAGHKKAPFTVTMWDGTERRIISLAQHQETTQAPPAPCEPEV